jgi:uncharacterized protein YkwD
VINIPPAIRYFSLYFIAFLFAEQTSRHTEPESLVNDVLTYTNEFRKSKGLKPLKMHNELNELARKHSQDMASGRTDFGHSGFDNRGKKIRKIFESCTIAENVAYGATTGKGAVDQWKTSSSHRKNILGNYTYIGIGTAKDRRGRIYYTQLFVR